MSASANTLEENLNSVGQNPQPEVVVQQTMSQSNRWDEDTLDFALGDKWSENKTPKFYDAKIRLQDSFPQGEVNGKFVTRSGDMLNALGMDVKANTRDKEQQRAQNQLMAAAVQAAEFEKFLNEAPEEVFLAELKNRRRVNVPASFSSPKQKEAFMMQMKAEWRDDRLDQLADNYQESYPNGKNNVTKGIKTVGLIGGAINGAMCKNAEGKAQVKWLGAGNVAGLFVGGAVGFVGAGMALWAAEKLGSTALNAVERIVGKDKLEPARNLVDMKSRNRTNVRNMLEKATEAAVPNSNVSRQKVRNTIQPAAQAAGQPAEQATGQQQGKPQTNQAHDAKDGDTAKVAAMSAEDAQLASARFHIQMLKGYQMTQAGQDADAKRILAEALRAAEKRYEEAGGKNVNDVKVLDKGQFITLSGQQMKEMLIQAPDINALKGVVEKNLTPDGAKALGTEMAKISNLGYETTTSAVAKAETTPEAKPQAAEKVTAGVDITPKIDYSKIMEGVTITGNAKPNNVEFNTPTETTKAAPVQDVKASVADTLKDAGVTKEKELVNGLGGETIVMFPSTPPKNQGQKQAKTL
jgi:hypothetical protein